MPFIDPLKKRAYHREYIRKYRLTEKGGKKSREYARKYYHRNKSNPEFLKKIYKRNRKYYAKNKKRLQEYGKRKSEMSRYGRPRKEILERDSHICQICFQKKNLCIHHIDGNGRNAEKPNNKIDNLITLCQNCHTVLHRFKSLKDNKRFKKLIKALN